MSKLNNWSCVPGNDNIYAAPEAIKTRRLTGNIFGDARFNNGDLIITSLIKYTEGRFAYTIGGGEYLLGEPHEKYLDWLKKENMKLDEEHPVKVKDYEVF